MIMTAVLVPALLAHPRTDVLRVLFLCFAFASIVNVFFVLTQEPEIAKYWSENVQIGYTGYFLGKNYLGECAALAFLLAVHEMLYPGHRRAMGVIVMIVAIFLIFKSESKTALGLAILLPLLAALTLLGAKKTRLSPAIILLSIPFCYFLLGTVSNSPVRDRLSYMIFGDPTLTGRTIIWDFATNEIALRPLLGWGYQSFWLVGPDAPSIVDAPLWVKGMPDAHSGYYDATLEMGHIGYYLLLICVIATLHAIGRVAQRDGARAWLMLSVVLYFLSFNYLESLWMRGFEFLWVVFLIIAAEIGRYWQPSLARRRVQVEYRRPSQGARPLQGARRHARKLSA